MIIRCVYMRSVLYVLSFRSYYLAIEYDAWAYWRSSYSLLERDF